MVTFAYKLIHELGPQATNHCSRSLDVVVLVSGGAIWLKVYLQGGNACRNVENVWEVMRLMVGENRDRWQCSSQEMKVCSMVIANICF